MIEEIRDKQRIIIAGTKGKEEIFELAQKILKKVKKSFIAFSSKDKPLLSNAPIALILCETDQLLDFEHHIAVVSEIKENGNSDHFEGIVNKFEKMADQTPKGGSIIYSNDDAVSQLICKKERPDVRTYEYGVPKIKDKKGGYVLKLDDEKLLIKENMTVDPIYIKGCYRLMRRIGVTEKQFVKALS